MNRAESVDEKATDAARTRGSARRLRRWKVAIMTAAVGAAVATGFAMRSASAGLQSNAGAVVVDTNQRVAHGFLGFARSGTGTGTTQRIGCYTLTYGSGLEGLCTAVNSAGVTRTCTVSALDEAGTDRDKVLFDVIAALSGDSFLQFTWDSTNKCTSVRIGNSSDAFPKSP